MDPLAAHQRAHDVFSRVLANVSELALDEPTPCEGWRVRDLIEHVISGNERVIIRSGLRPEPAARPGGLVEAHRATAAAAHAVFAAPGGLAAPFDLPIGQVPGSAFIRIRTIDGLVHAWDLAKATGQSTDLDPELATWLLTASRGDTMDGLRGPGGVFGDPQPCAEDRPPADQLAAVLGRPVDQG